MIGLFGIIVDGVDFMGKGGMGVKDGFLFVLILILIVCFVVGFIDVVEFMGGMKVVLKIFNLLFRFLFGIFGIVGIVFVFLFISLDVVLIMMKELFESGEIIDDERIIFVVY